MKVRERLIFTRDGWRAKAVRMHSRYNKKPVSMKSLTDLIEGFRLRALPNAINLALFDFDL